MSWLTPSPVDFSGYGPQLNAPPQLQVGEAPSGGGIWDTIKHWGGVAADAIIPGNVYLQDDRDWLGSSTLVGIADFLLGAGGLGILINERIGWRDYEGLGMVLLSLFILVLIIDFFTDWCRSKLS